MDEAQQQNIQRIRDEYNAMVVGLEQPFWKLLDRELAKREQLALDAIATGTEPVVIMRTVGEWTALRTLRRLPESLRDSLRGIVERARP